MNCSQFLCGASLFCCSFSAVFAEPEFSKIEEEILLNPPGSGGNPEQVIIYSRVRNKTIHTAMDTQFNRIETMMFVDTIVESQDGGHAYAEDDDCD